MLTFRLFIWPVLNRQDDTSPRLLYQLRDLFGPWDEATSERLRVAKDIPQYRALQLELHKRGVYLTIASG